jgi:hypothetical protein
MAIKGIGKVTVTFERSTVEQLRARKGSETWDEMLLRLARRQRCGIECIMCGKWIETKDIHVSPSVLAEMNDWREVRFKDGGELGFVCPNCAFPSESKEV